MAKYLNLDENGKIISLIDSNDPTLSTEYLFKINDKDYKKVYKSKNINKYEVKNEKLNRKNYES